MSPKLRAQQKLAKLRAKRSGVLAALETDDPAGPSAEAAAAATLLATDIEETEAQIRALEVLEREDAAQPATRVAVQDNRESDPMRGFRNGADFAHSVHQAARPNGRLDPRLAAIVEMGNGGEAAPPSPGASDFHRETHADEGYLVPSAMSEEIRSLIFNERDLLQMVDPTPTNSNFFSLKMSEETPWATTGVRSYWVDEGEQITKSKASIPTPRTGELYKLAALVDATDEVLQDAPQLNRLIMREAPQKMSWVASEAIMNGNGVGKPFGWRNSPAKLQITKETGQAADTVVTENLVKMFSRLLVGQGNDRIVLLANTDTFPQWVDLRLADKPAIVALGTTGLQGYPNLAFLGVPISWSAHCETLGDAGDVQLVNLSGYHARVRETGGIQFATSIHLYFDYARHAFRWLFRLGGLPLLTAAVSPAKGSATQSHFIEIAARA